MIDPHRLDLEDQPSIAALSDKLWKFSVPDFADQND
jgi:hypothetical protein